VSVIEHVGKDAWDDGKRAGSEEASEEPTYQYGLEVFSCGYGDGEDGEAEGRDDQGWTPALKFGEGGPDLGIC